MIRSFRLEKAKKKNDDGNNENGRSNHDTCQVFYFSISEWMRFIRPFFGKFRTDTS